MSDRDAHISAFALDHPWAITRPMLQIVARVLGRHLVGHKASADEIQAALVKRGGLPQPGGGAVAIIPVHGVLVPRASLLDDISGGTSYEDLTGKLRDAMSMDAVKTIVLDVNSPGGSVAGATEFAREVLKARRKKAIVAVAQYTMCSAAYWIASCATKIVAAPSANIGNVGVFMIHEDLSKALEMEGIKETYIYAGKYKIEGNPSQPLDPEAQAYMKKRVDAALEMFIGDISRGRGASKDEIRNGYGEGRDVDASEALALKMIDEIGTLDETIARAMEPAPTAARAAEETSPAIDTAQEPLPATAQDRTRDDSHTWRQRQALALLDL